MSPRHVPSGCGPTIITSIIGSVVVCISLGACCVGAIVAPRDRKVTSTVEVASTPTQTTITQPTERSVRDRLANPNLQKQAEGREQLRSLYREMDQFKELASYNKYGFASGGPHYQWLQHWQTAYSEMEYGVDVLTALWRVHQLASHYRRPFLDTLTVKKDRASIERVIAGGSLDEDE